MRRWRLNINLEGATNIDAAFLSADIVGDLPDDWTPLDLRTAAAEHFGLPLERIPEPKVWGRRTAGVA